MSANLKSEIKILILAGYLKCPPISGGVMRMINPLFGLAKKGGYKITYFCEYNSKNEFEKTKLYFANFPNVEYIGNFNPNRNNNFLNLEDKDLKFEIPLDVFNYMDLDYYLSLEKLLQSRTFDIVQIEHSQMSWVTPLVRTLAPGSRVILDLHNVEYMIYERWLPFSSRYEQADIKARFEKMRSWEQEVWKWYDGCLTVSREESDIFQKQTSSSIPAFVVPTGGGIDVKRFDDAGFVSKREPHSLVYCGTMEWFPNAHGLLWFLKEVMPLLKQKYADIRLYIGGFGRVDSNIASYVNGHREVVFLGQVDDDRDLLYRGSVSIVPLWIAAGARVKISTAWAARTPVVATKIGAEGLCCTDGKNIFITDIPEEYARRICELMVDQNLAARLSAEGRELVDNLYSLDYAVKRYDEIYRSLLGKSFEKQDFMAEERSILRILQLKSDVSNWTDMSPIKQVNRFRYLRKTAAITIKNEGLTGFFRKAKWWISTRMFKK